MNYSIRVRLITLFAVMILFFSVPSYSYALGIPFGGRILKIIPCLCSPGIAVIVGPPRGGSFLFIGKGLYAWWRVLPGSWVLGDYSPGATCWQPVYKGCSSLITPVQGTILKIGTS